MVQRCTILSTLRTLMPVVFGFFLGWGSAFESLLATISAGTQPLADADNYIYTKPSPPAAARVFSPARVSSQHLELISELLYVSVVTLTSSLASVWD